MSIDFGRATTVVRSPKEGWSARIDVRTVTVCLVLVALALAIGVIALGSGDYQVPIGDVLGALFGEAPRVSTWSSWNGVCPEFCWR